MQHAAPANTCATLTSGDIARALKVDLKTVHRWVQKGAIHGQRTKGGHLRFHRVEVARFLRSRRLHIPDELGVRSPRVLTVRLPQADAAGSVKDCPYGLFDALLELTSGEYDVVAINLDRLDVSAAGAFVKALRSRAATQPVGIIAVSQWPDRWRALLAVGADLGVASAQELTAAVSYVAGVPAERRRPQSVPTALSSRRLPCQRTRSGTQPSADATPDSVRSPVSASA